MKGSPNHSPALEAAINEAAAAVYGPGAVDFAAAGDAVRRMLKEDACDPGSESQQLAVGTLILDLSPVTVDEEEGEAAADETESRVRVIRHADDGQELDGTALTRVATEALRLRGSVRDQVLAYCALRLCEETPGEGAELHAAAAARNVVRANEVADTLTRVYARRVLTLVAEDPDEIFEAVRQAQDESNAFEVIRLVESGRQRLKPERAMSLLAIGINAAEEVGSREQELSLVGSLGDVVCVHFHQLHHASASDEAFCQDERAIGLAAEMGVLADRLEHEEGCANAFMIMLAHAALANAILDRDIEAVAAIQRLRRFAETREGGVPSDADALLHNAEEILAGEWRQEQQPQDEQDDPPDEDDPTTRADWWKNN